jgi:hypothetical protein
MRTKKRPDRAHATPRLFVGPLGLRLGLVSLGTGIRIEPFTVSQFFYEAELVKLELFNN